MGSDEDDRSKKTYEKMLELELNHIYRDIYAVFKVNKYKPQEELNVDNFKENLDGFVGHIKGKKNHQLYSSF